MRYALYPMKLTYPLFAVLLVAITACGKQTSQKAAPNVTISQSVAQSLKQAQGAVQTPTPPQSAPSVMVPPAMGPGQTQADVTSERQRMDVAFGKMHNNPEYQKAKTEYLASRDRFLKLQKDLMIKEDPTLAAVFDKIQAQKVAESLKIITQHK